MKQPSTIRRHALRVLARYHGAVVIDQLYSSGRLVSLDSDELGLPPPHEHGLGVVRWLSRREAVLIRPDGARLPLTPDEGWSESWDNIELELSVVPEWRVVAREYAADLSVLFAVAAMLLVAVILEQLALNTGADAGGHTPEVAPELIARLLEEDYDGADEGYLYEEKERPSVEVTIQDIFLPSGDRGPTDTLGGAREVAEERQRGEEDKRETAKHQPLPPELPSTPTELPTPEPLLPGVEEPQRVADNSTGEEEDSEPKEITAEVREGFGLKDWYGAEDARKETEEIQRELDVAREMIKIDPDSPWALQQLAYFQYLAEDYSGCRQTYDRYIELYPESAAGYNNLALVYKRLGEYGKEEGYYRLALAIEPGDEHALTNLAVNLAHQERFDEALGIMDRLAEVDPNDPYADLHRSKIYAAQGDDSLALAFLERALAGMEALDTLHHIEFRQDIRVDPAFSGLRDVPEFNEILVKYYGRFGEELKGEGSGGRSG